MPEKQKISQADLYRTRFLSARVELVREQLLNIEVQQLLLQERLARRQREYQEATEQLDAAGKALEQKYGVEDAKQIDWETGEIRPPATEATDRPGSFPRAASSGTGGGTSITGAPGANSADEA